MFGSGGLGTFPWWHEEDLEALTFLLNTELSDGRVAALLDIGAVGNLAGDRWIRKLTTLAFQAGLRSTAIRLNNPINVSGVGNGSQRVEWKVSCPATVTDVEGNTVLDKFTANVIPTRLYQDCWA